MIFTMASVHSTRVLRVTPAALESDTLSVRDASSCDHVNCGVSGISCCLRPPHLPCNRQTKPLNMSRGVIFVRSWSNGSHGLPTLFCMIGVHFFFSDSCKDRSSSSAPRLNSRSVSIMYAKPLLVIACGLGAVSCFRSVCPSVLACVHAFGPRGSRLR